MKQTIVINDRITWVLPDQSWVVPGEDQLHMPEELPEPDTQIIHKVWKREVRNVTRGYWTPGSRDLKSPSIPKSDLAVVGAVLWGVLQVVLIAVWGFAQLVAGSMADNVCL